MTLDKALSDLFFVQNFARKINRRLCYIYENFHLIRREMFYLLYDDYNHSPNQPLQTKTQPCCDILLPCNTHPFLCHVIFNSLVYLYISSMFGSVYNNVIISTAALVFFGFYILHNNKKLVHIFALESNKKQLKYQSTTAVTS